MLTRRDFIFTNISTLLLPEKTQTSPRCFVFIGDSITDGNRGRNDDPNHILGHGYVFSIATRIGGGFPKEGFSFINKGISGDTVTDLAVRWQLDVLAQQPDVLTILVGINDFHKYISTSAEIYSPANYEQTFRQLLKETKTKFPSLKIVLLSPFLVPVGTSYGKLFTTHQVLFRQYFKAAQKVALEFGAIFIDLQHIFEANATNPTYEYWIWDGIHPTYSGHELITQAWLQVIKKQIKLLKRI